VTGGGETFSPVDEVNGLVAPVEVVVESGVAVTTCFFSLSPPRFSLSLSSYAQAGGVDASGFNEDATDGSNVSGAAVDDTSSLWSDS